MLTNMGVYQEILGMDSIPICSLVYGHVSLRKNFVTNLKLNFIIYFIASEIHVMTTYKLISLIGKGWSFFMDFTVG